MLKCAECGKDMPLTEIKDRVKANFKADGPDDYIKEYDVTVYYICPHCHKEVIIKEYTTC